MKSEHYKNAKGEPYSFLVKVYTRPNLRGSLDEMFMYRGKRHLEMMFDECSVNPSVKDIDFQYPERWANILELRAMIDRIPISFPNIENVTITTHSVYIIQCVYASHIRICDDPSLYPEKNSTDLKTQYGPNPSNMNGLYVVTPDETKLVH